MARHETLAAVDLGSNSLHLFIGRVVDGQIYPLDSLREAVRLGAGLTADKRIDRATQARALETLGKFGERLRGFPRQAVRAVGTNALRVAKNAPQFLREARAALGFPIEVIAGREEARLIYLGVAHTLPKAEHRRLVVDVGGGSTEFIIGTGLEPQLTESLYMGCVSYSLKYFPDGEIDKPRMKAAELAARQELAAVVPACRALGWQESIGSSGTVRAIESILIENGYVAQGITREGLDRLRSLAIKQGRADPERIPGLRSSRAAVFAGGLAILVAVFDELGIERMAVSDGALRHGVLYDLLGRVEHRDMREATVTQFMRRYHVDAAQAERVRQLALRVYDALLAATNRLTARPRTIRIASCSTGRRASRRSGCRSRTRSTTSIPPTSCRTRTCRAFRAWSSSASRAWCWRTAASSARCRTRDWRTTTGGWCSRCGSHR